MGGCPRKTRWDFVNDDMKTFGQSCEEAHNNDDGRKRIEPTQPRFTLKMAVKKFVRLCNV